MLIWFPEAYTYIGKHTSPSSVFSKRPFTIRAEASLSLVTSLQLIIGVLMDLAAFMISLMRGTPSVTFIEATPAKWNVLSVIWVPGSPIDCAPTAPTVEPTENVRGRIFGRPVNTLTWFDASFYIFHPTQLQERPELTFRHLGFIIHDSHVRSCVRCTVKKWATL